MIWFTSDQHYFHKNVIGFCNRPFLSIEEMNERLIANHNERVQKQDTAIILGDFIFGGTQKKSEIIPRLNGTLKIVLGNHDDRRKSIWDKFGVEILPQGPFESFSLSHYPWKEEADIDDRYLDKRLEDNGGYLLHGHVHTAYRFRKMMINVGVDQWDYYPVSLTTIHDLL